MEHLVGEYYIELGEAIAIIYSPIKQKRTPLKDMVLTCFVVMEVVY